MSSAAKTNGEPQHDEGSPVTWLKRRRGSNGVANRPGTAGTGDRPGAVYTYLGNSDLVEKTRFQTADNDILATAIRSYEADRDLLSYVQAVWRSDQPRYDDSPNNLAKVAYTNNALGLRTAAAYSGWAYGLPQSPIGQSFVYNPRQELTDSSRAGTTWAYAYDNIGNRKHYTYNGGSPLDYCADGLNRYLTTAVGDANCPPGTPAESFSYDGDGNLTQDGTYTYEWDGENRLRRVWLVDPNPNQDQDGDRRVNYVYDYRGRRVEKTFETYQSGHWFEEVDQRRRFIWDGWRMLLELDALSEGAVLRKYTWGLDLAGLSGSVNSLESAGGISGLLAVHDATVGGGVDYVYCYDGNGNVASLVNLGADYSYQATVARYEYDPYGNRTNTPAQGEYDQPFRFSTKQLDAETGLYYFGYRYYMPRLGRWISRDPIGERGERNLYVYVHNSAVSAHDPVGLDPCEDAKAKGTWDGKGGCNVCDGHGGFAVCINACETMNLTSPLPFQCQRTILPSEACPPPPEVPRDLRCSMEEKKFCVALEMHCGCEGERAHRTSDFSCVGQGSGDPPTVQVPKAPNGVDEQAYGDAYAACMRIRSEKQSAEKRAECYEQHGGGLPCAKAAAEDQRQTAKVLDEGLKACAQAGIQLPP